MGLLRIHVMNCTPFHQVLDARLEPLSCIGEPLPFHVGERHPDVPGASAGASGHQAHPIVLQVSEEGNHVAVQQGTRGKVSGGLSRGDCEQVGLMNMTIIMEHY